MYCVCRFYFAYCEAGFDAHYIHNFQVTWTKTEETPATAELQPRTQQQPSEDSRRIDPSLQVCSRIALDTGDKSHQELAVGTMRMYMHEASQPTCSTALAQSMACRGHHSPLTAGVQLQCRWACCSLTRGSKHGPVLWLRPHCTHEHADSSCSVFPLAASWWRSLPYFGMYHEGVVRSHGAS